MAEDELRKVLEKLGQPHLFFGVERLSAEERRSFLAQLKSYPPSLPRQQKELLALGHKIAPEGASPCAHFDRAGNREDAQRGRELVLQGKVGCLVLAGGQGTRLGHEGPKGAVGVSAIQKKSLFQLICEKTKAASAKPLPLCFMTSPLNHTQTVAFFEAHHFFGLTRSQLTFFQQQMLPFTDDRGGWLFEKPGVIAEGPDGNGHALRLFYDTGLWQEWKGAGVEYLNVIFVDNALADPFDAEFVGFTARKAVDAALKAIERRSGEKMGVLAERKGKLKVIEYSELPADNARYNLSSTGMFCLPMEFIGRLCGEAAKCFPLHLARKAAKTLTGTQEVWKYERFLFDLLDQAESTAVLVCPRERIYAPLKNASGGKSVTTVAEALQQFDREIYRDLTGREPAVRSFELDPAFYYPTDALKEQLRLSTLYEQAYVGFH